jgi:spiro-SPASM protein
VGKTVFFASSGDFSGLEGVQIEKKEAWTKRSLLEKIAELSAGFDIVYFAFADCPFLDPALTAALAERHRGYAAEYSYADGWPYGLAPELLAPGTAGILAKILGEDNGPVTRDILFSVIQKDINAFDIETEISPVDLRCHRISLASDSKRNLLLLKNFFTAAGEKTPAASDVERIVAEQPEILRTLPGFYPIQVYGGCPQSCSLCPYPSFTDAKERTDFMDSKRFESLLDKITAFSGDAVIDLSLWGELSLHPEKMKLIETVITRGELALVIETSGLGWKGEDLEKCACFASAAELSRNAGARENPLPPLSWIVSLDTADPRRYREIRGQGYAEANDCAKKLFSLFPETAMYRRCVPRENKTTQKSFTATGKKTHPSARRTSSFKNTMTSAAPWKRNRLLTYRPLSASHAGT